MVRSLILVVSILLALPGCRRDGAASQPPPSPPAASFPSPAPVLDAPLTPETGEEVGDVLAVWRRLAPSRPTLVLLSQSPFLGPLPPSLVDRARNAALTAPEPELARAGKPGRPDPLFLPEMTVRLALSAGFFRELVWVLPSDESPDALRIEVFRRQLIEAGFLTEAEARELRADKGAFVGAAAGVPFRAVHPHRLPALEGPAVLHFDLSYFQALYRNEVKTPVFELVRTALTRLREARWPLAAVTLSCGNASGRVSRDMRFLGPALVQVFADPAMLDRPLPDLWRERADALYLATFLETEKVLEKLDILASRYPDDPAVQFDLYRALRARKEGDRALSALEKAARLDGGYAPEYMELAQYALEKGLPVQALEMLDRAGRLMSDNPFPGLFRAEVLAEAGRYPEALVLLGKLEKIPWSPVYFPGIPKRLAELRQRAESYPRVPGRDSPRPSPTGDSGENKQSSVQ